MTHPSSCPTPRFAALAIAISTIVAGGCHKTDLGKAQTVFRRWDRNWSEAKGCLVGKAERSTDLALQIDLHALFDDPVSCNSWLNSNEPFPAGHGLDAMNEADDWLRAHENASNTWTELEPEELTDEAAAAALELDTQVRALQKCGLRVCPDLLAKVSAVIAARDALRAAVGLPADPAPTLAQPTQVVDVAPRPRTPVRELVFLEGSAGDAPINATWKLTKTLGGGKGATYAIASAAGSQVLDAGGADVAVGALRDDADPIVWFEGVTPPGAHADDDTRFVRVFQQANKRWVPFDVGPVRHLGVTPHRLDVLFSAERGQFVVPRTTDPNLNWLWFSPGSSDHRVLGIPVDLEHHAWACSSTTALWEGVNFDDGKGNYGEIDRWEPRIQQALIIKRGSVPPDAVGCEDDSVLLGNTELCTRSPAECKRTTLAGTWLVLFHGAPMVVSHLEMPKPDDPRRQLVLLRTPKQDRVVRLPPKVRIAGVTVRDGKVIGAVLGAPDQELELQ